MQTAHEYFNLVSGLFDLGIAVLIYVACRRITDTVPRVAWVLIAFFAVSGAGYLNEPSPVFGSHPTVAVALDVLRLVTLGMVAYVAPRLARALSESLRAARWQAEDRRQAMLDRHYEI